jgi:hypothetical protein
MLTHKRLRELLDYDPHTGFFQWRVGRKGTAAGTRAGNLQPNGYRRIMIDKKKYYEQRLAWFYVHGVWPPANIDHKDPTPDRNALANIRPATQSQNLANRRRDNTSGYKGVGKHRASGLWYARLHVGGRQISLGYYRNIIDAHNAYTVAARRYYGAFARPA